ncbi:MAG: alpha-2-macroglobulin family protein [Magnetococcales bacterium]|nr:alpha-2-macroglobulin family protein [Magnetococcales bacterium]
MASGHPFFLMTDSGFSGDENVVIRLEGTSYPSDEYSGIDILVYRVPEPLEFLRKQPNLHRVRIPGRYEGEGLYNAMNQVWDVWYKKSRLGWQRLFSEQARAKAVAQEPLFKEPPAHAGRATFEDNPQYLPLSDFPLISRFRYPLWAAKPPVSDDDTRMEGSSSNFYRHRKGNVLLPLGPLKPGLYLVEGWQGRFRAITMVFVSNTAAITKTSGRQLFVWTAAKQYGTPVEGARLLLTDGAGILQSGVTAADGTTVFDHPGSERSYLIAQDREGGIFVSENFYYDSEIHNAKLYAFTDRSLYRPGDTVRFKLVGRHYHDAQTSERLKSGPIRLTALDSSGAPVTTTTFHLDAEEGGDGSFQLPDQAPPGGYTMRLTYQGEPYAASFRVARYAKPHYDLDVAFDNTSYTTGQPVTGTIRAYYPGGQPVVGLSLELSLRSQTLAMSDYEHRERGRFPVKLTQAKLSTNDLGAVRFTLPAVERASRLTLRVVGSDGTSSRVSAIRELLVQASAPELLLETDSHITRPGETVSFTLRGSAASGQSPLVWNSLRLEDRTETRGGVQGKGFSVVFDKPGSYQVEVRDGQKRTLGSLSHWVAGEGMKSVEEGLSIVLDKDLYRPGDTVHALITFAGPVQEALLTLERDRVHHHALLSGKADWLRLKARGPNQWEAEIPVTEVFQPNVTLSVALLREGRYDFRNKGIRVEKAPIAIVMTPDKAVYGPGEEVTVTLQTSVANRPVAANLAIGVVDEMVYVLQPELAPDIRDFFGHWRRNQVRTLSSLNFHAYDHAISSPDQESPVRFNRPVKLLERPRRENIDTAAWFPRLKTDARGWGRFSFVMPDSLTRWRITARATTPVGEMGQEVTHLVSEKPAYLKWSGPDRFRRGDEVETVLLAFNRASESKRASLTFGENPPLEVMLQPGINHLTVPLKAESDRVVTSLLSIDGQVVDRLETPISVVVPAWSETVEKTVPLTSRVTPLELPPEARKVRIMLGRGMDSQFQRVAAGLLEYPYGCAEQTASRLIPLALAYGALRHRSLDPALLTRLRDRLANQRFRLAQMAGPEAEFTWWGDQTKGDLFFTAYAYFADYLALTALGLEAPEEHWMRLMAIYQHRHAEQPVLLRALTLWLAKEMKLPVISLAKGVVETLFNETIPPEGETPPLASRILYAPLSLQGRDMALLLLDGLSNSKETSSSDEFPEAVRKAAERMAARTDTLSKALSLMHRARGAQWKADASEAAAVLTELSLQSPTLDRALALIFVHRALGEDLAVDERNLAPEAPWLRVPTVTGGVEWRYPATADAAPVVGLNADPPPGLIAHLTYESPVEAKSRVDMGLRRRLYRLTPVKDIPERNYYENTIQIENLFQAKRVAPGEALDPTALYLDEVVVDPRGMKRRFGLLEVALPTGAELEPFTWGMGIQGVDGVSEMVMLSETRAETGEGSYAVPVAELSGNVEAFRHLVRFPLRGRMQLPPVRYFSMVNPEEQAFGELPDPLVVK